MDTDNVSPENNSIREVEDSKTADTDIDIRTLVPETGQCAFFVLEKKRQCRMTPRAGEKMCPIHFQDPNPKRKRVPCPLDPKHTVFVHFLKKHLKICNARNTQHVHPFYSSELNSALDDTPPATLEVCLRDLDDEQLLKLVEKINTIGNLYLPDAVSEIGDGSCQELQEEIGSSLNGHEAKRHLRQTSSILHILEKSDCLKPNTCLVEFGSGKGGLTYWVAQALTTRPKPETQSFVLVDRTSPRYKKDNKLAGSSFKVERIRIDIKDLKLDEVKLIKESEHLVGMSKHLCGNATDMALTCLLHTNSLISKVSGFVFATCCHHRCTWDNYVGKSSFLSWGFTPSDFKPLTGIATWYVCGTGKEKFAKCPEEVTSVKYSRIGIDFESRRLLGLKAKRLLDFARCEFVKSKGIQARSSIFASSDDTFENVCIIGQR